MNFHDVKALTFDTGGTILDWHTGFRSALEKLGKKYEVQHDWASLANEIRRRSLGAMLNLGEHEPAAYNFDDAHRRAAHRASVGPCGGSAGLARSRLGQAEARS